jgi:hypothetical protein
VHLPEPVGAHLPQSARGLFRHVGPAFHESSLGPGETAASVRTTLAFDLPRFPALDDGHREVLCAVRAADSDLDRRRAAPVVAGDVQVADGLVRDEAVADADDLVRAVAAQAGDAVTVDRELDTGAPAKARRSA